MARPLPSIRTRLLVSFLAIALGAAAGLSLYLLDEVERYGLRKLEERLESQSRMLAAVLEAGYEDAGMTGMSSLDAMEPQILSAALQEVGSKTVSRVRVVDARGFVVADSTDLPDEGPYLPVLDNIKDRPEVSKVLAGADYGAHTRIRTDSRVALYVAVPITLRGEVVGVAYSSASTFSIRTLLRDYRQKLALLILAFTLITLVLTEILSRWLANPLRSLEAGAVAFASGDHSARVSPSGSREVQAVADAFNKLADEVEAMLEELRAEESRRSRFVSDVSHELRTPLTAIRGTAETLMQGDVDPEEQQRFLQTIMNEADRLTRLANDLLHLKRMEGATGELPLSRVDLEEAVRRAIESMEPLLRERAVHIRLEGSSPKVLGDIDRLQQVVSNLLDNATRMSPGGSKVTIRLSRGADGRATLSMLDEGPGIPDDALDLVFERFYRSQPGRDRSSGGAGLGLAIVKAIVEAHAGTVTARNRPEGGAEFVVQLPAADASPSAA